MSQAGQLTRNGKNDKLFYDNLFPSLAKVNASLYEEGRYSMGTNVQSFIVSSEEGPVWNMEPGRPTTFKLLSEQTHDSVAVFEELVPAGGGTPLHVHLTSDELIYVLSGDFTFKIEEQLSKHGPGTWVFIPRGIAHAWKNSGAEPGRAFFIFTPAEGAKCFEELRAFDLPIQAIDPTTLQAVYQRYGYEMVGPWL